MFNILMLRSHIMNIIILGFLMSYSIYCEKYHNKKSKFMVMSMHGLSFVVFGLITEITVNVPTVSPIVNDICHILYLTFGLGFLYTYFIYIMKLSLPENKAHRLNKICLIIFALSEFSLFVTKVGYAEGELTNYCLYFGSMVVFCVAFITFFSADIVIIIHRKTIKNSILFTILPMSIISSFLIGMQLIFHELLLADGVVTLVVIGVFFTIENPIEKLSERAFKDMDTGTYNRNCYDRDLDNYKKKYDDSDNIAFIVCDINDLKYANDNFGHFEGDKKIQATAAALLKCMESATKVYRIGGDEFIAVYEGNSIEKMQKEIERVRKDCEEASRTLTIPLSLAMGFAIKKSDEKIEDTIRNADKLMYEDKKRQKL